MATDPKSDAALEVSAQAEYMRLLKNAPIAEFAAYAGIDIDEAVNRRVAAAIADATPNMEITARPIKPQKNLYGFASVKIGGIKIDDFKILTDKENNLFVGMPSKPDKTSTTGYRSTVFVDKDFNDNFSKAVIGAYTAAVEQAQNRAADLKAAPDKQPERMADQVAKAAKEAEKHNAALPPAEKNDKKRDRA